MSPLPRVAYLALALLASLLLAGCGALDAATVSNVAEYQIRKAFPPLLVYRTPPAPASLSGMVRDEAGQPIASAVVLVSTVRGEDVYTRSDAQGRYRLDGIAPGRVTPWPARGALTRSTGRPCGSALASSALGWISPWPPIGRSRSARWIWSSASRCRKARSSLSR